MSGLQKPPRSDRPSRIFARVSVLLIMAALVGLAVWAAVTDQRIGLVETTRLDELDRGATARAGGMSLNLEEGPEGGIPVLLLHDYDVAGSLLLDPVASVIDERFQAVKMDLPGFGLSERVPDPGDAHTVASMAEVVGEVIEDRWGIPVVVVGVGLGGEVAAELAVTNPRAVVALVMVDVDFWDERDWVGLVESLPYLGRPAVYTFEAGGRYGLERWAPQCDEGGWCPTSDQIDARALAASIGDTTNSLKAFLETPKSSLVPSDLGSVTAPVAYVWSTRGPVPEDSVEMVVDLHPDMTVIQVDAWKAHLESPDSVLRAIEEVAG